MRRVQGTEGLTLATFDVVFRNVTVVDGSGGPASVGDVAVLDSRIASVGQVAESAKAEIDGEGLVLAPGFIDVHTHDDLAVLKTPGMLPKLSQGVTTVITGNCGISAAPVTVRGSLVDPMNLLGVADEFRYATFAEYVAAVNKAMPAVNVAALVGHTALRSNHMDRLDRTASAAEIAAMRAQLQEALDSGALGLSTGLAYLSAISATTDEVIALAEPLAGAGGIYTTHMRSETEAIRDAMDESFAIGRAWGVPVIVSHLKCAGVANWGRSEEVLAALDDAREQQAVGCDCYPYAAGSSTLDLRQIDPRVKVMITWCRPHPEMAGKTVAEIAEAWGVDQVEAGRRLQPAGAIYHSISEADMRRVLAHPATMIGSDGLPCDPLPHPRLWGTFPRVLGRYCRDEGLFSLEEAVHKMTGLPARRFQLDGRGLIREGYAADMVLFDPQTIRDCATFTESVRPSQGIHGVWVNGVRSYDAEGATGQRAGRFLPRGAQAVFTAGASHF